MKNQVPTIEYLRKNGYKVRVIHREINSFQDFKDVPAEYENGVRPYRIKSLTRIDVTTPDGRDVSGFAFCTYGDQYNRKLGNRIALGRAWKKLLG